MLGTFVEIGVPDSQPLADAVVDRAFGKMDEIQQRLSFHQPESDLSKLNRSAGNWISISPLALRVLRLALAMTRASHGYFNCTVGGGVVRKGALPNHEFGEFIDAGDADDLEIHMGRIRRLRPVLVTLDGIAKGFAVDVAIRELMRGGLKTAWVNAGGDMRVYGETTLPVHRRDEHGEIELLGGIQNAALASSDSKPGFDPKFPGLMIPKLGGITAPGVWSVIARQAWRADALTKVAALAPPGQRHELVEKLGGRIVSPATS